MFHNYYLIFLSEFSALSSSETKTGGKSEANTTSTAKVQMLLAQKEPNSKEIKKPTIKNNCMINKTNLKQHSKWFNS